MTGHCGSLPLLYTQPIMAPTSSKLLVVLSTDEHKTTSVNVTQMLSSLTHLPRLKWLDNLSPHPQPHKLYSNHLLSEHPLLLQHNHLFSLQHPSKLQPKALQQPTHIQRKTPPTADVQPPTGRTVVTPHRWSCVSKAPQRLIEQM